MAGNVNSSKGAENVSGGCYEHHRSFRQRRVSTPPSQVGLIYTSRVLDAEQGAERAVTCATLLNLPPAAGGQYDSEDRLAVRKCRDDTMQSEEGQGQLCITVSEEREDKFAVIDRGESNVNCRLGGPLTSAAIPATAFPVPPHPSYPEFLMLYATVHGKPRLDAGLPFFPSKWGGKAA